MRWVLGGERRDDSGLHSSPGPATRYSARDGRRTRYPQRMRRWVAATPIPMREPERNEAVSSQSRPCQAGQDGGVEMRKVLFSGMGRSTAMATVVAIGLTTVGPVSAFAGSAPAGKGAAVAPAHGI